VDAPALAPEEVPQGQAGHQSRLPVAAGDLHHGQADAPAAVGGPPTDDLGERPQLPRVQLERVAARLADERQAAEVGVERGDRVPVHRDVRALEVAQEPLRRRVDPSAGWRAPVRDGPRVALDHISRVAWHF
jgi:hypothetical protein